MPPQYDEGSIEALTPHPQSTKVMDTTYMRDMQKQIDYVNVLLKRLALSYVATIGDPNDVRTSIEKKKDRNMKRQRLIDIRSCLNSRINEHLDYTVFGPRCQFLCQLIYKKLLLELRELVYESLFAESRVKITNFYLAVAESDGGEAQFPPALFDMTDAAPYAHVFQDVYAQTFVCIEMLKFWYQHTTFMFDDSEALDGKYTNGITSMGLLSFFRFDRCANYKLRDIVRTIELTLPLPRHPSEEWLLSSNQAHPQSEERQSLWWMDKEAALCREYLLSLKTLKPGACILLSFTVDVTDTQLEAVEMFDKLFEILEYLLHCGHRIWVSIIWVWTKRWLKFEVKKEELTKDCWKSKEVAARVSA